MFFKKGTLENLRSQLLVLPTLPIFTLFCDFWKDYFIFITIIIIDNIIVIIMTTMIETDITVLKKKIHFPKNSRTGEIT